MQYTKNDHTFVVCAYGESPFLSACIASLRAQTVKSHILIATSTPNAHIAAVAQANALPVFVNDGPRGIGNDWNFGLSKAVTPLATLAHQDDVYEPDYLQTALSMLNGRKKPLLFFSDYAELRGERRIEKNRNLRIKRIMLWPLRLRALQSSRWLRRRILSLGCPICCPSVTFVLQALPAPLFGPDFRCCVDWQAWERVSRLKGSFVYSKKSLMAHRIHAESETSRTIAQSIRTKEEQHMFRLFWPAWIAGRLARFYKSGQDSNQSQGEEA